MGLMRNRAHVSTGASSVWRDDRDKLLLHPAERHAVTCNHIKMTTLHSISGLHASFCLLWLSNIAYS